MLLSPSYFSISSCSLPAITLVSSNGHAILFASKKRFWLVDTGQCVMENKKTVGLHQDPYDLLPRSHCLVGKVNNKVRVIRSWLLTFCIGLSWDTLEKTWTISHINDTPAFHYFITGKTYKPCLVRTYRMIFCGGTTVSEGFHCLHLAF
jgi:hypothetical protein